MANSTTITLGTSTHYFKSSVSITLDQGVDETLEKHRKNEEEDENE